MKFISSSIDKIKSSLTAVRFLKYFIFYLAIALNKFITLFKIEKI